MPLDFLRALALWWPGMAGIGLRRALFGLRCRQAGVRLIVGPDCEYSGLGAVTFGNQVVISSHCSIHAENGTITVGDRVSLGRNASLDACDGGDIRIGSDVLIAQNVVLRAADHRFDKSDVPISAQGHLGGYIVIGSDVWVGANCVVVRNVTIGDHAVVGAGAVVTRDVPAFAIVAGVPARVIGYRDQVGR
jgi:galactoside O-acetyltransferase